MESIANQLRKIQPRVDYLLEHYERSRDDDKYLYMVYLRVFCDGTRIYSASFDAFAKYIMDGDVPIPETVSRARRKIQESGKWLSQRQIARRKAEQEVRSWAING